ncbi:hypothetical protein [Antrihabitans sp. YC2-6]|uniref:hypothetical protein n=1 Tax=Antrihabitans sp. YC2-6 TaxID=2799498 RepID=UPI0018F31496|nr:hypothetical protein [Antrihabitans sp. YC2-6]MBJ8347426.1 hypothetical protein [Antrihabitans sp. YC2-6]
MEAAAFGAAPGTAPLPAATNADEVWLRAVALGGQGRYSAARSELARLRVLARTQPALQSLARSTAASYLRQLGWHRLAAVQDGAALALAARAGAEPSARQAHFDALTGLAADALGSGRLPLGRRLLQRCDDELSAERETPALWRQRIRFQWVAAEISLAGGAGIPALAFAEAGYRHSMQHSSLRHQVKSRLLVAAALSAVDRVDESRALAGEVVEQCAEQRLLPLRWAAAMLLAGGDEGSAAMASALESAREIESFGGSFRTM